MVYSLSCLISFSVISPSQLIPVLIPVRPNVVYSHTDASELKLKQSPRYLTPKISLFSLQIHGRLLLPLLFLVRPGLHLVVAELLPLLLEVLRTKISPPSLHMQNRLVLAQSNTLSPILLQAVQKCPVSQICWSLQT